MNDEIADDLLRGVKRIALFINDDERSTYHKLPQDVLSLDFSGWTIFVHAQADDELVTQICAGLDARKARIPWEEPGDLPVERMAREAPDTPQAVPLHPAAERFWRSRGYI